MADSYDKHQLHIWCPSGTITTGPNFTWEAADDRALVCTNVCVCDVKLMEFLRTDNIKQPGVSTSVSQTNSHYCTYYNKRIKRGQRAWWKKCGQSVVDTASSWQKLIKLIPITHVGDCKLTRVFLKWYIAQGCGMCLKIQNIRYRKIFRINTFKKWSYIINTMWRLLIELTADAADLMWYCLLFYLVWIRQVESNLNSYTLYL